jgi:hypothetical protein
VPDLHGLNTNEVDWLYAQKTLLRLFQQHADSAKISAAEKVHNTDV